MNDNYITHQLAMEYLRETNYIRGYDWLKKFFHKINERGKI